MRTRAAAAALLGCLLAIPPALAQETPSPEPTPTHTGPEHAPHEHGSDESAAPVEPQPTESDPAASEEPELTPEEKEALAAAARLEAERARVRGYAIGELERTRERLAEAVAVRDAALQEYESAAALRQALLDAVKTATGGERDARRELGNLARYAYTSGPSEWTLIETILEADSASDAMRRAAMTQRVAEAADGAWDRAVETLADLRRRSALAAIRVQKALTALDEAQREVAVIELQERAIAGAIAAGGFAEGDGVRAIARLCGESEDPHCERSGWGEGMMTRDAVWLMRVVRESWPQIEVVGGYRAGGKYPDHPSGRAVDIMIPDAGRNAADAALGDEIALHLMEHADRYGIMYLIWEQRIWHNGKDPLAPIEQWRVMEDRGDWTSNHFDHIHITVSTGVSGWDIHEVLQAPAE